MSFPRVSEMFKHSNEQKTIEYIELNYLLETRVSEVWPSSSVFLNRNILSVIYYGLITHLDIESFYGIAS